MDFRDFWRDDRLSKLPLASIQIRLLTTARVSFEIEAAGELSRGPGVDGTDVSQQLEAPAYPEDLHRQALDVGIARLHELKEVRRWVYRRP